MNKVDFPNLSPSMCVVCTSASGGSFVDTFYSFEPGVHTELNGRKYLCEACVLTAADTLGLFDPFIEREKQALDEAADARDMAERAFDAVDRIKAIPRRKKVPA